MFIRYYLELSYPRGAVEAALLDMPESLIPGIAVVADDRGQHLLADVGFAIDGHRISKHVEITVGAPIARTGGSWTPITWRATGPTGMFPLLDGELELASLGPALTQLSLSARYQPPLGPAGRIIDKALMARIAEATIKDFVDRLAGALVAALALAG